MKLALLWVNFGPYHFARAQALAESFDLYCVQYARAQDLYGWTEPPPGGLKLQSLTDGSYEQANRGILMRRLWRVLNTIRPDVLLIPGYADPASVAAAVWGRLHSKRNILMSESNRHDRVRSTWKESCKTLTIRTGFDGAVVGGRLAADYLDSMGLHRSRIRSCYDVVDNRFFANGTAAIRRDHTAADFGLPERFFLFVGRLAPEKNLQTLLRAFSQYRRHGGNWPMVIAGTGPLEAQLRHMAADFDLAGKVIFAGRKSSRELLPYYAFANWLVLPSVSEPWGLVVNEAMASGIPVILSRVCGCGPELLNPGRTGFLFDPASENELERLLHIGSTMPKTQWCAMSNAAQAIMHSYSPEKWAEQVRELVA